jgi:hypothetical protein
MRLDRYIGETAGKYSIIENRKGGRIVHVGDPEDDFFVLKLKDANAGQTLLCYADQAEASGDLELAEDVRRLAIMAMTHPHTKRPD